MVSAKKSVAKESSKKSAAKASTNKASLIEEEDGNAENHANTANNASEEWLRWNKIIFLKPIYSKWKNELLFKLMKLNVCCLRVLKSLNWFNFFKLSGVKYLISLNNDLMKFLVLVVWY